MRKSSFLAIVALLLLGMASASGADLKRFLLRGHIYSTDGVNMYRHNAVDSVEIDLKINDTVPVPFKLLTGNDKERLALGGEFRIMVDSGLGDYTLTLYKDGYEMLIRNFSIASVSENVKYLGLEMKKEKVKNLNEITVHGTRVKMVMKGDTVVFDAAAFQLAEGSMLDELVRQLPGATLSADGVIEVNGRKINELLVNGKDFFKGDPKVALQNLPAFTVKNLKVYDKAADDAYLTHSDAKLDTREEEQNLVMDVELKKEYNNGWMANAEAGYGTEERYMGRGFALGYTDKFRLAAFVNMNNTGDHTQGGTSGQWRGSNAMENGRQNILMTGLDYSYKDGQEGKIELYGNVAYSREHDWKDDITSSTRFFPSGDLYGRSDSHRKATSKSVSTYHNLRFRGKNLSLGIRPSFNWRSNLSRSQSRSATFTMPPEEDYRGEALDSVFAARQSGNYSRYMLTRLLNLGVTKTSSYDGRLAIGTTYRPKSWKGMLQMEMDGSISHSTSDNHRYYAQHFGPQSTSQGAPVHTDNFSPMEQNNRSFNIAVNYNQDFRTFGEHRTKTFSMSYSVMNNYSSGTDDKKLYTGNELPDPITPPSVTMPEKLIMDYQNSPYTFNLRNETGAGAGLSFVSEPTAPGDSTLNLTYRMGMNVYYRHNHEHLSFSKPEITHQLLTRNTDLVNPNVYFGISSTNKVRNIFWTINYRINRSAPSLSYFLDNTDTSDPLNIYKGNPDGLSNALTHGVNTNVTIYRRGRSKTMINTYAGWQVSTNQVAYAQRYDPSTGVTIHSPENISGNWNAYWGGHFSTHVGAEKNMSINLNFYNNFQNSADYLAINSLPTRSSVYTTSYQPNVYLSYNFKNGSSVWVGMSTTIGHQHSAREGFNNFTWYEYWPYIRANIKLPQEFQINTQFNPYFRRGYTNKEMNTTEYVWNATIVKGFKKGVYTLKLTAVDLLNSAKHVYSSVNAQGRTETWRSTIPRYVLLSFAYRLDIKPKKERAK